MARLLGFLPCHGTASITLMHRRKEMAFAKYYHLCRAALARLRKRSLYFGNLKMYCVPSTHGRDVSRCMQVLWLPHVECI
jgi:hypothetical protein